MSQKNHTPYLHNAFRQPDIALTITRDNSCINYWYNMVCVQSLLLVFLAASSIQVLADVQCPLASGVQTTRDCTVSPIVVPTPIPDQSYLRLKDVELYASNHYSSWIWGGPAVDAGPLLPDGTRDENPAYTAIETLLTFFTITDIHITDKESPAQIPYEGVVDTAVFGNSNTSAYSPVILSTTQVLDAAIQTINALHQDPQQDTHFDFGMALGDAVNNNQYNELRWYLDVIDGKTITPSSGANKGAKSIDYQRPYKAAGLDKSIPWYQVLGNHDQYWCGSLVFNDYVRRTLIGKNVLNMGEDENNFPTFAARDYYVGVVDGADPYGHIIADGLATDMATPKVAADPKRRALSTNSSNSLHWMKEFFNTSSKPIGHGFNKTNIENDFASYSFEPKADLPLKVIALDDTCKLDPYADASAYARACLDQERYDWLINELEQGQAEGKLMIIAAHVPVGPIYNNPDIPEGALPNDTVVPLFLSTCHGSKNIGTPCPYGEQPIANNDPVPPYTVVTDATLLAKLHEYSNLLLWISGHRHQNTVTVQPAPQGQGPEFGFWEVETSSLRDFPQQFRTFKLVKNSNNSLSIVITNVDPAVQSDPDVAPSTPAAKSRGYAIGAGRISSGLLNDTGSHAYNAELIKDLPTPYTITVHVSGAGKVTSSPYSGIDCTEASSPCTASFLPGTAIHLVATPSAPGTALNGWSGASSCYGTADCGITMINDTDVTATFSNAPTLTVMPDYKALGSIKIGKTTTATFTVKNTAKRLFSNLSIGTVSINQTDPLQFTLVKDQCSDGTLKPGQSCHFKVAFKPTSAYTKSATISISSNDLASPQVIQITGVGK
jgi:hypothetical protein